MEPTVLNVLTELTQKEGSDAQKDTEAIINLISHTCV